MTLRTLFRDEIAEAEWAKARTWKRAYAPIWSTWLEPWASAIRFIMPEARLYIGRMFVDGGYDIRHDAYEVCRVRFIT